MVQSRNQVRPLWRKGSQETNCPDIPEVQERMRIEEEKRKSQQENRERSMKWSTTPTTPSRTSNGSGECTPSPGGGTSNASNSNDPTDNREHLSKSCIYARIEHHTSQAHRMRVGKPGTRHGICVVHFQKGKV